MPVSGLNLLPIKVFYDPSTVGVSYEEISERAGNLPSPIKLYGSRIVVHIQTSEEAVYDLLSVIRELAEEKKAAGFIRNTKEDATGVYRDVYVRVARKT